MFEMKQMVFPSGDHAVSPTARVIYNRCRDRLSSPCSTSALALAVICFGSVIATGAFKVCERAVVLMIRASVNCQPKDMGTGSPHHYGRWLTREKDCRCA